MTDLSIFEFDPSEAQITLPDYEIETEIKNFFEVVNETYGGRGYQTAVVADEVHLLTPRPDGHRRVEAVPMEDIVDEDGVECKRYIHGLFKFLELAPPLGSLALRVPFVSLEHPVDVMAARHLATVPGQYVRVPLASETILVLQRQ